MTKILSPDLSGKACLITAAGAGIGLLPRSQGAEGWCERNSPSQLLKVSSPDPRIG